MKRRRIIIAEDGSRRIIIGNAFTEGVKEIWNVIKTEFVGSSEEAKKEAAKLESTFLQAEDFSDLTGVLGEIEKLAITEDEKARLKKVFNDHVKTLRDKLSEQNESSGGD